MEHKEKLVQIRKSMAEKGIDAYIIPSSDPHISEYLPERYKAILWTSGFTGSAGTLMITQDFAGLWTDSRYFVQAKEQLEGTGFELVKLKAQSAAEYVDWIVEKLNKGATVGFDGQLASVLIAQTVKNKLEPLGFNILGDVDLLDPIWAQRPELPKEKAYLIDETTTGESTKSKLFRIQEKLKTSNAEAHLISSLDDLAWVLNIRGNDVPCNPVVLGFLLIEPTKTTLFIDVNKLNDADRSSLAQTGIEITDYNTIYAKIEKLHVSSILIDPKRTCYSVYSALPKTVKIIEETNSSTLLKAIKNEVEVSLIRQTMIKDGVSLTKFFKWLEEEVASGELSEISIAEKLERLRAEHTDFVDISFDTIAGYLEHGALPHYKATDKSNATLKPKGLLLVDSGGQYKSGTTDITRVVSLGDITAEEKEDYSYVLKGMIEGSNAIFPKGTRGYQIDAITRRPMWESFRNYGHGTGHGVGFFLNVHEGPHVFNPSNIDIAIEPGTVTSIEPGLYKEGEYGIRIENLVLTKLVQSTQFGEFYDFETLTICYIATDLVDKNILEQKHINWLNRYNQWVFEQLSPKLSSEESDWLKEKIKAI